ncbi:MAG TPA: MmcQ/YjbR family DNA-binding protein [Chloroflexota bacterium]|jgi:hypothetical protein|nr:MmcQ/YjbR family DNA-binding protein [Chloroflexota bacterium]
MEREEFRSFALSLPEAVEIETWGHPTFRVREKIFATLSPEDDSASVKTTKLEQIALVGSEPEVFGVPAYVGRSGWVTVQLERVDPDHARELIEEAWRQTAPKRLVKAYDSVHS